MIEVGVRDLKNGLSRYLTSVKQGEDVVITERGRPVAKLVKMPESGPSIKERLAQLAAEGFLTLPEKPLRSRVPQPLKVPGKPLSQIVIEDRR